LLKTYIFFPQVKTQENSTFICITFLYPPENVLLCQAMLGSYQVVITFMLCCC